jgi:hypothetical protein
MIRLCTLLFMWQVIGVSMFSVFTFSMNETSSNNMVVYSEKNSKQTEFYSLELTTIIAEEVDELFEIEIEQTQDDSIDIQFSPQKCFNLYQKIYQKIFIDLPFSPPEVAV